MKALTSVLAALLAIGFWCLTGQADVTGNFGLQVSFTPLPCKDLRGFNIPGISHQPCESVLLQFDFETEVNIAFTMSGFTLGFHSHAGATGLEDIILTLAGTLGMLDIIDFIVFAQPFGVVSIPLGCAIGIDCEDEIPTCYEDAPGSDVCHAFFVRQELEFSLPDLCSLFGFSCRGTRLTNLVLLEDVHFPTPGAAKPSGAIYTPQSQSFGFGDLITLSGQTPNGITATGQTSFCTAQAGTQIKKHGFALSINPDCAWGQQTLSARPPLFFDFESFSVRGIPLSRGITLDVLVECASSTGLLCAFASTLVLTKTQLFDQLSLTTSFTGSPFVAGGFSISSLTVVASGVPLLVSIAVNPSTLALNSLSATANFIVNPDTNPANLRIVAVGNPAITAFEVQLSAKRSGFTFFGNVHYGLDAMSKSFDFDRLTLGIHALAGIVVADANVILAERTLTPESALLLGGNFEVSVAF